MNAWSSSTNPVGTSSKKRRVCITPCWDTKSATGSYTLTKADLPRSNCRSSTRFTTASTRKPIPSKVQEKRRPTDLWNSFQCLPNDCGTSYATLILQVQITRILSGCHFGSNNKASASKCTLCRCRRTALPYHYRNTTARQG